MGLEAPRLPVEADGKLLHLNLPRPQLPCIFEGREKQDHWAGRGSSDYCAKQGDDSKTTGRGQPGRKFLGLVQQLVLKAAPVGGKEAQTEF